MKAKIKLRDVSKEDFEKWVNKHCGDSSCMECMFKCTICTGFNCWVNHKELFSDKFLEQEIEIEKPDILDEVEKQYLVDVIKPFKNIVVSISKQVVNFSYKENKIFYYIRISVKDITGAFDEEFMNFPYFKTEMYKGMENFKEYTLKELGLFQKEYKITLTEFWNSKEKLAIHCNAEEKANKLLKAFDKLGKKWFSESSYLKINHWDIYEKNTCYNNNNGYSCFDWHKENGYNIYEFEDVDLDI